MARAAGRAASYRPPGSRARAGSDPSTTARPLASYAHLPLPRGRDEADLPAEQQEAGKAPRVSPPHGDKGGPGHRKGAPSAGPGSSVSLSGRPPPVHGQRLFATLVRDGRRARGGVVTVHFVKNRDGDAPVRVAYSVSRRVGGAVVRNTWRRRLRSIAAEVASELEPGSYLIGLAPEVRRLTFKELEDQVCTTMRRASGAVAKGTSR